MNLPEPEISRDLAMRLWIEERSDYAKEQVLLNNKGIVGSVMKSLNLSPLDEDLFATGVLGLVKAINTFDDSRGFAFCTYAAKIVRNEILFLIRKKTVYTPFSLDEPYNPVGEIDVSYGDVISDEKNLEEEVIAGVHFKRVMELLSKKEKRVISLRASGKTQEQIAKICGISQANVSRIESKIRKKIKE